MNTTTQIAFSPKLIFAVVAALIVLSMIMGRKQRDSYRSHYGWWIGLGILLVLVSGFLGFTRLSVSPIVEERRGHSSFKQTMTQVKEQISAGVEAARESVKGGLDELNKSMDEAQESLGSVGKESKSTSKSKRSGTTSSRMASSTLVKPVEPLSTVQWTVEVTDHERSQQQELVAKKLHSKAVESVNRWVNDRMPIKSYGLSVISAKWLSDNGAFPEPIEYIPDQVPRANSDQTDKFYGGTLTVVMPPNMQQTLLDLGYQELEQLLQSDKLEIQFILFTVVMGITGFVAILGLVKMVVTQRVNARQLPG